MKLEPGTALGSYRIISELGRGGMATVYKAYQASLARNVAVKVLPEYFADEPGFKERFQQEAIAVANLRHRHIPAVHDYGEADGVTYIVSEYIDGGTLTSHLGTPVPLEETIEVLEALAEALDYAHSKGVLHRDVKPSNVLLERDGTPVLADFGLAKIMASDMSRLTRTGTIVGTPEYMSPEQCEGENLTPAADLYALGVVAYEMLTGRPPFLGPTPLSVILAQVRDPLPPPRSVNPQLPESIERVLMKALAKRPEDRYATCTLFVRELAAATADAHETAGATSAPPALEEPQPAGAVIEAPLTMLANVVTEPVTHAGIEELPAPAATIVEPAAPAEEVGAPAAEVTTVVSVPSRRRARPVIGNLKPGARRVVTGAAALAVILALIGGGIGLARLTQLNPDHPTGALASPTPTTGSSPSPAVTPSPSPSPSTASPPIIPAPAIAAKLGGTEKYGGSDWIITGSHFTPHQTAGVDFFDQAGGYGGTYYPRWTGAVQSNGTFRITLTVFNVSHTTGKFTACDTSKHCASVNVNLP